MNLEKKKLGLQSHLTLIRGERIWEEGKQEPGGSEGCFEKPQRIRRVIPVEFDLHSVSRKHEGKECGDRFTQPEELWVV